MKSILVFDVVGAMAHFRRFDTNSSSLTYSFPPRTVISGVIAGILGFKRDSYYDLFQPELADIGLSVCTPPRKIMQTINYMFVKNKSDLNNSKGHTQIPVEFLLSDVDSNGNYPPLRFRIFFRHEDEELMKEVKERVIKSEYIYPPYLGLSELLAKLEWVEEVPASNIEKIETDDVEMIHTVCNMNFIKERSIQFINNNSIPLVYRKEKMARSFNADRTIKETASYLYEKSNLIKAIPSIPFLRLKGEKGTTNLLFM
ncbi:type I-B CRISPR-associated protein Cas5b [Calidifontibacillus erzurumensis]|uniref:type I-B CRISPR-associated protein Cas5b n=1 Tax=Calidifontibacillus erzurumensis TaxID=2741433 RepID=UPI002E7A28D7|nr:type I-B CRISPR-associated protein Cas5b [Calidifontibacillus erzurumensis]